MPWEPLHRILLRSVHGVLVQFIRRLLLYSRDLGQKWAHHCAVLGRMWLFAGRECSVDVHASIISARKYADELEFCVEARNLPDDHTFHNFVMFVRANREYAMVKKKESVS